MTRRTRYFLIGSTLVILVGVGTGLVAVYGSGGVLRSSAMGPAELAYVPGDTTAIVHANVHDLLGSPLVSTLRHGMPAGQAKDPFFTSTGIDLEHDIDSVTVGYSAPANGRGVPVSLFRGRFNQKTIEDFATQHGATAEEYRGKRLLTIPGGAMAAAAPAPAPSGSLGVAFLEPGLIALGEVAAIKRAIDTAGERSDVTKNTDVMKLVADVDTGGNAWAVGRFDAFAHSTAVPEQVRSQIPALQWVAMTARVDDHISGRIHAEASDAKSADNLRGVINGALAAARMMAAQNPKLDAALNGFQATGMGKTVEVTFSVPADSFDALRAAAAPGAGQHLDPSQVPQKK